MVTIVEPGVGRRMARWQETDQTGVSAAALRAEMRRRGMIEELLNLREAGLEHEVRQLLAALGAQTRTEALGSTVGVLTDLAGTRD
ncbi:MAG: hypothetical protein DYG94_01545 [Leptolyngbya sp. PLA3]|nr:MAG: hypothetical protein EDM82_00340 [Cyanobacteria bacterium CYA]MCE7967415.1 hypothetical protein [Leptolyngbya sp. PL-A3]